MQGKSRSVKSDDLAYIFFKIRATRCPKTRRSWQRRARIALAKLDEFTPEERHEICCVWANLNASRIDSPAMSKLFKKEHQPQPHQTISARSCTRKRFNAPERHYSAARTNPALEIAPRRPESCKPVHALFLPLKLHFQGYIYQRLHRDSALQPLLNGNPENPRRRRGRMPETCKLPKIRILQLMSVSKQNLSKNPFLPAHEMNCRR